MRRGGEDPCFGMHPSDSLLQVLTYKTQQQLSEVATGVILNKLVQCDLIEIQEAGFDGSEINLVMKSDKLKTGPTSISIVCVCV